MLSYNSSHTSALIAGNDDLMTEILLRLPVKSLLRFKSVSKRWLSLISDPHFSHVHCRRNPTSVTGLFLHKFSSLINPEFDFVSLDGNPTGIPFRSLTFTNDAAGIRIVQSCNGLLCCSSFRMDKSKRTYYIYNPTTNHYTTLPRPGGEGEGGGGVDRIVFGINLAFDPSKSPHYKVVCLRSSDESLESYQIEIYSSETGTWKPSGDPFTHSNDLNIKTGVYWNGSIHWIDMWGPSLCFEIERESLRMMPMPPIPEGRDERWVRYFGECQGHLHLIEIYNPPGTLFDVLEMESDYSKWFVKYRVDLDAMPIAYPEMVRNYLDPLDLHHYAFYVLCVVRGEKEEESLSLVLHIHGKVISYNLKGKTFKKLHDLQLGRFDVEGSLQLGWFDAYQYIETLSCV